MQCPFIQASDHRRRRPIKYPRRYSGTHWKSLIIFTSFDLIEFQTGTGITPQYVFRTTKLNTTDSQDYPALQVYYKHIRKCSSLFISSCGHRFNKNRTNKRNGELKSPIRVELDKRGLIDPIPTPSTYLTILYFSSEEFL